MASAQILNTGKAMYGLLKSIKDDNLRDKRILFIHTGGIQEDY